VALGEGPVKAYFQQTNPASLLAQVIHGSLDGIANGTHGHQHMFSLGMAVVIKEPVAAAQHSVEAIHVLLHDSGYPVVIGIGRLSALEVDIGVLGAAPGERALGIHAPFAKPLQGVQIKELRHLIVFHRFNFLVLMGGAEPVEKVQKGNTSLKGSQVGNAGQIHHFLHIVGRQHSHSRLAAGHHILVVSEDGQGMGGNSPGTDMDHTGQELTGDLVQIGHHEQKALGRGESAGQGPGGQGSMQSPGGPDFRLHFHHFHHFVE